ncbi:DUF2141 domain-containing protein [Novosphingobium sp. FKTRR1]|uniref:DUF2141 domain-containing protein n=1 Tax=unclassified Novosphingobium TaxID=2644732 RepID=UPI001CEFC1B6|nr:DUF2141 domain-containing protein [Novosphingobium sp. FKTRR1]
MTLPARHWRKTRRAAASALLGATAPLLGGATMPSPSTVTVDIEGLRSTRGLIQACLTADPITFPDCQKDPQARHVTATAADGPSVVFRHVLPGRYAIALFHDENANGRMDKVLMVPREGFGFSRDAPIRFGPPRFDAAEFPLGEAALVTPIKVRYLL